MAHLIKSNNKQYEVLPLDGNYFKLKELQSYVGGSIQMLELPNGLILVCNENGIGEGLALNKLGTFCIERAFEEAKVQNFFGDLLFLEKNELPS